MENCINQRVKDVLATKGYSVLKFAKEYGIAQSTLNAQISGKSNMAASTIVLIATAFEDISPDWLLLGKGEMLREQHPEHNVYDINYGNQVTGNGNITGNTAPVHYNTETEEDAYNELVALRNKTRELQKKLDEANDRNAALTDKLLKLI